MQKNILIYTDGGVQNNGHLHCFGASAFLIYVDGFYNTENVVGLYDTTNNRAELQAIINSLTYLKENDFCNSNIVLFSDSQYCVKGCTIWMDDWKKKNFIRKGKPMLNVDLWKELLELKNMFSNLQIKWIKAHSDNEFNNYVDYLCTTQQNKMINNEG